MKRRTDNLRCPTEIKHDLQVRYSYTQKLNKTSESVKAFNRKPYQVRSEN